MGNNVEREFYTKGAVAHRYGVSTRTIDRYLKIDNLAFPQPIYLGNRPFWKIGEIENWEISRATRRLAKEVA